MEMNNLDHLRDDELDQILAKTDQLPKDERGKNWGAVIKQVVFDVSKDVWLMNPLCVRLAVIAMFLEDRVYSRLLINYVRAPYDPARGAPDPLRLEFDADTFRVDLTRIAKEFQAFCASQG